MMNDVAMMNDVSKLPIEQDKMWGMGNPKGLAQGVNHVLAGTSLLLGVAGSL